MKTASISVISDPGVENRPNEDGWLAFENRFPPGWISAAVIDGASIRIPLPSMQAYLAQQMGIAHPVTWATSIVRDEFYKSLSTRSPAHPVEALMAANRALYSSVKKMPSMAQVYDLLTHRPIKPLSEALALCPEPLARELQQAFLSVFSENEWHLLDTRYLRLLLPICVATTTRLNISSGAFDFAHAGDTALVQVDATGKAHLLTQDQMGAFDDTILDTKMENVAQQDKQIDDVIQAVKKSPAAGPKIDKLIGVRHNYVSDKGQTQPGEGCGAINGLPELADYIQRGNGTLNSGERLYLMSDGLVWPMLVPEERALPIPVRDNLTQWWQALRTGDLTGLLRLVRAVEDIDASLDIFPRIKLHDDATAVVISLR